MADQYFARLSQQEDLPPFFDGVVSALDEFFADLAVHGVVITFENFTFPPNAAPEPAPITDPEDGMLDFQGIEQPPPPLDLVVPSGEQPAEPTNVVQVLTIELQALTGVGVGLPGIDGISLVLNPTPFEATVSVQPGGFLIEAITALAVRFDRDLLVPMRDIGGSAFEEDPTADTVDVVVAAAAIRVDEDGVDIDFGTGLQLARPAMIGQTGVIVESANLIFNFDGAGARPEGALENWRGVLLQDASIRIPAVFSGAIVASGLGFGNGGVTGTIARTFPEDFSQQILGMPGGITEVALTFRENILTQCAISARVRVAFFDEENPLDLLITIGTDGTVTATLAGSLATLEREDVVRFDLTSITFGIENGKPFTSMSGRMTPLAAGLAWPSFVVEDLRIDAAGNVTFAGGWVDLPEQVTLDLYGFVLEITRVGFGKTDGGQSWIGFNGALRLMEGIPAGASVEGLRILFGGGQSTRITMEGVGVELEVPGVVRIAGKVSLGGQEFAGAVRVELPSISFQVDGQFVVGTVPNTNPPVKTYAVFLETQLPAGIPLAATGLAFYGVAGLYAHNREPAKEQGEGWYRNPDFSEGWFTRPQQGVTDLQNKWRGAKGHMALGAGIILGTYADNGYLFNGRLLLVLVFPGPVILLEGMANLFKKRTELGGDEPNFHALLVIEPGKSFTAGLDAQYKFGGGGELLEIRGSAEAFFSFDDASAWYINLGVDAPIERRIGARIFQLFDVNGFFMLNQSRVFVGAGWYFHKVYGWKHLNVTLDASMEGSAIVSWHPSHFTGSVGVQGGAELHAFGVSTGITVGATVSGDVFDPFGLKGSFHASLNLPWPLPDISKTVEISWERDFTNPGHPPPLPVPLREASIEHIKSRNTWPLLRGQSLLADDRWNSGDLEFERPGDETPGEAASRSPAEVTAPSIPADSKVAITFTRPTSDPNLITLNPVEVRAEVVGDPSKQQGAYTTAYTLLTLDLQKWAPGDESTDGAATWVTIRQGGATPDDQARLVATWLPAAANPGEGNGEQHKLLVNAQTPFDYLAERSQSWLDWFTETHPNYPCPLSEPGLSARFTQPIQTGLAKPFSFEEPAFVVDWMYGGDIAENEEVISSVLGPIDRGLRWLSVMRITPPPGATDILIRVGAPKPSLFIFNAERGDFDEFSASFAKAGDAGSQPNPLSALGVTFRSRAGRGPDSALSNENVLVDLPDFRGRALEIGERLEIDVLGGPWLYIELEFDFAAGDRVDADIFAVAADGSEGPHQQLQSGRSVVRLHTKTHPIAQVVVRRSWASLFVRERLFLRRLDLRSPVLATAIRNSGPALNFLEGADGIVRIHADDIREIVITRHASVGVLLLELALPGDNQGLIRHTQSSLSQLAAGDPLFEPENHYRLVVTTTRDDVALGSSSDILDNSNTFVHHAHFHVAGPPGVGAPDSPPEQTAGTQAGLSLSDLRLYIEQTLPPTIPREGDKLLLPRAFYRGYDVAVKFNESYGELLYLRARRDLSVRLYNVENEPARRADGRVSIPSPSWEQSRTQSLTEATTLWIGMVNGSACRPDDLPPFDASTVPRNQTVSAPGQDVVLAPETLYQARLVPSLLHEAFIEPLPGLIADGGAHRLERWVADGTSRWHIESQTITVPGGGPSEVFFVEETTAAASTLLYAGPLGSDSDSPDAPSKWSDFRASVLVRWSSGIAGIDFRRASASDLLRLTLDRGAGTRQLSRIDSGTSSVLADDTTTFPDSETDVAITIECVGNRVNVFQDDELVFDETTTSSAGTLGLHVNGANSVRFTEIRVDDLRPTPSTAFTFDFVTSKYTSFHHHLHSYSDQLFGAAPGTPLTDADLTAHVGEAVAIPGASAEGLPAISDEERRAFDALEATALGSGALSTPQNFEISRVSAPGAATALLIRSPEPLRWERTLLAVTATADASPLAVPGDLKLSDATFGSTPLEESVTILVRRSTSLARYRLEWRSLPSAANPNPAWSLYFDFGGDEPQLSDGTQVRVLAVASADAPQREPGTIQRFVASGATPAAVHFVAPGVELRLVAPNSDTVAHQRRFQTPDAFYDYPMHVLRKLDGTGLILFTTVSGPAPARLRLHWTFNRAVGEEDLRFRQGGSETPENAALDVVLASGP
jgi:hypothetical protein